MAKGGKRPGAGRPKGRKDNVTLEKEAALEHFRERVRNHIDPLFNSQITLAKGCTYLYRIDEHGSGKEKTRKHILVTDPEEIRQYLDNEVDENTYYYITAEKPENQAIQDMLNRTFGKPKESIELSGGMTISKVLDQLDDRSKTPGQKLEAKPPLQNPR